MGHSGVTFWSFIGAHEIIHHRGDHGRQGVADNHDAQTVIEGRPRDVLLNIRRILRRAQQRHSSENDDHQHYEPLAPRTRFGSRWKMLGSSLVTGVGGDAGGFNSHEYNPFYVGIMRLSRRYCSKVMCTNSQHLRSRVLKPGGAVQLWVFRSLDSETAVLSPGGSTRIIPLLKT